MATIACSVTIEAGLTHQRRSVALLQYPASYVDAFDAFRSLGSDDRYYRKSFDLWMGNAHRDGRYHGFNKSDHGGKFTKCYVFKNIEEGERFYGFLCRPKEPLDPHHEMCVLVLYAQKKKWKTDVAELARAERMRIDLSVQAALKDPNLFRKGVGKTK